MWSRGQVVKTPPFHGGIMGSNPVGITNRKFSKETPVAEFFYVKNLRLRRTTAPHAERIKQLRALPI